MNILSAILLLVACSVPYVSNAKYSFLSLLSLTVPVLVGVNFLFFAYWGLKGKKQLRLSLFVLVFGYFALGTFVKFKFSEEKVKEEDLSIMSYNVRGFNKNEHLDNPNVFDDIKGFVDREKPDVICFQEPDYTRKKEYFKDYPYHHLDYIYMNGKTLLGVFSKYPILKFDFVCFPDSFNNASFVDILYKKDTVRIYNVHMESLGITPGKGTIKKELTNTLFGKLSNSFAKQQEQAKMLADDMNNNPYKQIVCGDFNNTQFSTTYKLIKGDKQDTFIEKGTGLGRTLVFHKIPIRIDFILADPEFEVKSHKNYDVKYSDHYPIMASFSLQSD